MFSSGLYDSRLVTVMTAAAQTNEHLLWVVRQKPSHIHQCCRCLGFFPRSWEFWGSAWDLLLFCPTVLEFL